MQDAIWRFMDGHKYPSDPVAQAIVNDAETNGPNFVPAPGQLMAVLLYASGVQTTFIEVMVPQENVVPEVPLSTVMSFLSMFTVLAGLVGIRRFRPKSH